VSVSELTGWSPGVSVDAGISALLEATQG